MAQPITWQNIAPTAADPTRTMDSASKMFSDMFSGLKGTLKESDEANKKANSQAIRQALLDARTPEQLDAALGSNGAVTLARAASGGNYDEALDGVQDARRGVLQQRSLVENQYSDNLRDRRDAPLRDALQVAIANGDEAAQTAWYAANGGMANMAPLVAADKAAEQAKVLRDRATTTFGFQEAGEARAAAAEKDRELNAPLQRQYTQAQINELNRRSLIEKTERGEKAAEKLTNKGFTTLLDNHRTAVTTYAKNAAVIAKSLGIPVDAQGVPQPSDGMVPYLERALEGRLGPRPSTTATLAEGVKLASTLPLAQQKAQLSLFNDLLSDGGISSSVDLAKVAKNEKTLADRRTQMVESNLFYDGGRPKGSPSVEGEKKVYALLDGIKDSDGTVKGIKKNISDWMTTGLKYTDAAGKEQTTIIPPKLMEFALTKGGVEKDAFFAFRNLTDNNAKETLIELLRRPEFVKMQEEAKNFGAEQTDSKGATINKLYGRPDVPVNLNSIPQSIDYLIDPDKAKK